MTNLALGPVGIATGLDSSSAALEAAAAVEELGYPTLWLTGGPLPGLQTVTDVLQATRTLRVASGILAVVRFPAADVASLYAALEADQPGRFIAGLGGAHGPQPIRTMENYLDVLDAVPQERRVLAALGPRMLAMARDRAAGAYPVLVTPEYTATARSLLGDGPLLAVQQLVVLETDASRAREIAREPLGVLSTLPGYAASFRRTGFTEDEISRLDDRLVDALIAWGDLDAIKVRVSDQLDAGADHVALSVLTGVTGPQPVDEWRRLAEALLPQP